MKIKPAFFTSTLISIALALFARFGISGYAQLFVFMFEQIEATWIVGVGFFITAKSVQSAPLCYRLGVVKGIRYEWLAFAAIVTTAIDIAVTLTAWSWVEGGSIKLLNIIVSIGSIGWAGLVRLMVLQWLPDSPLVVPPLDRAAQLGGVIARSVPPESHFVTPYISQPNSVHPPTELRTSAPSVLDLITKTPVSTLLIAQPGTGKTMTASSMGRREMQTLDTGFDIIAAMSKSPENTLILAPSESGKGIVIGNLIAAFKASTDCSVTAIDPKGSITEDGFFAQCDRVHRFKSQELDRDQIIAETKKGWKMFTEECRKWEGVKPCFILIDEMLVIGGCFSKAKDSFLQDKIASLVSMGRSQRQFCWIMSQYPQLDTLGIQGGIAGQMEMLIIARRKNITLIKPWGSKYDLTRGIDFRDMPTACDDSPVDRAVYWRGEWHPMPRMENKSGFDRETNTWIDGAAAAMKHPEITTAERGGYVSVLGGGENLDNSILDYFAAAHDRNPKTIKNLRDSSRLRDKGTIEDVNIALDRLTDDGQLLRYQEGWMLASWDLKPDREND